MCDFQGLISYSHLKEIKDARANCFCASLLRTQIHTPRHGIDVRAK